MRRTLAFAVVVLAALVIGCGSQTSAPAPAAKPAAAFFVPRGFDLSAMDTSIKACDDFYRFAVGKWRDTHPQFWKAYGCKDGDKMVREESKRCSIW